MMTDKTKTGVIGYPVGHSLSPLIHNYWLEQYGFPARYQAVEILPEQLESAVHHLVEEGYRGFNVTIPHKQTIMALCDRLDDTAAQIGAVNTVTVTEKGRLAGMNTDAFGFTENLRAAKTGVDFTAGPALVLGAGGAARAIVYGLREMGVEEIKIANRTREKAEKIAKDFGATVIEWAARGQAAADVRLLVNTTALGMSGQPPLEFDLADLPPEAAVCDIVYKPLHTSLLKAAKARGNPAVTGIGMLLHQARPAFKQWYGVMPAIDDDLERRVMEQAL